MARRKKVAIDPEEKARIKKLRALQRREARKLNKAGGDEHRVKTSKASYSPEPPRDDWSWIRTSVSKMYAGKLLNDRGDRPYWLSIPHSQGVEPVAHFYPCNCFRKDGRAYYGFMFQEHRDMLFAEWRESKSARKELLCNITQLRSRKTI